MPYIFLIAAVAAGLGAELVEGPAVGFLDPGGWLAEGGLVTMPDAVGAEVTLTRYRVDTGQASVVSAEVHRTPGKQASVRIRRVQLGSGGAATSTELRGAGGCMNVGEVDWTGGDGLQVEATGRGTSDPSSASVVLVEGNPRIGALVMLVPGDTAEVREVRLNGQLLRESLTVRHGEDVMALRREGARREVCRVMSASEPQADPISD